MIKLKHLYNKYFVFKGYVVVHQSDGVDNIIEFSGFRDLQHVYDHYVPHGSDVTLYADVRSQVGTDILFGLVPLFILIVYILLFY